MADIDLVRDVLDKIVLDRHRREVGRADGIVLEQDGAAVSIRSIDVGVTVLGYRLHPVAGRVAEAVQWAARSESLAALRVPFGAVDQIDGQITLNRSVADLKAEPVAAPQENHLRLEHLLGREVLAANNRPIGRLEEFRASRRGGTCTIRAYVIGAAALQERLGLGVKLLFGLKASGLVARWDQLDLTDRERPRLTCPLGELEEL